MFFCWTLFFSDKTCEGNSTFQKRHTSAKKKKKKRKKEFSSQSETEFVPEPSTCSTASPRRDELPDIIPRQVCEMINDPLLTVTNLSFLSVWTHFTVLYCFPFFLYPVFLEDNIVLNEIPMFFTLVCRTFNLCLSSISPLYVFIDNGKWLCFQDVRCLSRN